jgi:hypothetical protein
MAAKAAMAAKPQMTGILVMANPGPGGAWRARVGFGVAVFSWREAWEAKGEKKRKRRLKR